MSTLSIDLAYKRHADIGVALLHDDVNGQMIATGIPILLHDPPTVDALADWIERTAHTHRVRCLCIDGPLGWQEPVIAHANGALHSRVSERRTNAPGKTGPPHCAKPALYLPFIEFSIALFERLTATGWQLPTEHNIAPVFASSMSSPNVRMVTETFPTAAWRRLGLKPLAGKARAVRDVALVPDALERLRARLDLRLIDVESHDQLQAVVGGVAGLWWETGQTHRVAFEGLPPERGLDGTWREGYIILPASPPVAAPPQS